jgi:hypothetical protein
MGRLITQPGNHIKFDITTCQSTRSNSESSDTITIHFKTPYSLGQTTANGSLFYGDCVAYYTTISLFDVVIKQNDIQGEQFDFYYLNGVQSGTAYIEIIGGQNTANQAFTWAGTYQSNAPSTGNFIHADKVQIYTSRTPPPLTSTQGSSNLFQQIGGVLGFSPQAFGQSVQSSIDTRTLTLINEYGSHVLTDSEVWVVD